MTTFTLLKAGCLALYALALAGVAGLLPGNWASVAGIAAILVLAVHAVELMFTMKYVRLYRGPFAVSLLLAMLFGFLHWLPLKRSVGTGL